MEAQPEATLANDEAQLAAFAFDLAERIEAAISGWVERSLREKGGVAFNPAAAPGVAEETVAVVMPALRAALAADVDAGVGSPLASLRAGVTPMTECLSAWGSPHPPRDEFHERQFPNDPYQLGPAAFADLDPALHEPGLLWGAARAHVHLRRRREAGHG